jgi:transcriptional regulator with XRE-family HTH domain
MNVRLAARSAVDGEASRPGRLLADARRRAGLTQAELAKRLAISQASVAQLEQPESNPRIATLDRALRAAGAELVISALPREPSVDESLIRQQLALTPTQRLRGLEVMYRQARELAHAGEKSVTSWPEFRPTALLAALAHAGIDYVVVGGVAIVVQATPRFTRDLDICYATDKANLERLGSLLGSLQAKLRGDDEDVPFVPDARTLRRTQMLTLTTREAAFDLLVDPPGSPGYSALRRRADVIELAGASVRIASLEDLISMKRAAGRPQDQIDIESLEIARSRLRGKRR